MTTHYSVAVVQGIMYYMGNSCTDYTVLQGYQLYIGFCTTWVTVVHRVMYSRSNSYTEYKVLHGL